MSSILHFRRTEVIRAHDIFEIWTNSYVVFNHHRVGSFSVFTFFFFSCQWSRMFSRLRFCVWSFCTAIQICPGESDVKMWPFILYGSLHYVLAILSHTYLLSVWCDACFLWGISPEITLCCWQCLGSYSTSDQLWVVEDVAHRMWAWQFAAKSSNGPREPTRNLRPRRGV